jgi:hypothetical protein
MAPTKEVQNQVHPVVLHLTQLASKSHRFMLMRFLQCLLRVVMTYMQCLDVSSDQSHPLLEISMRLGTIARAVVNRQPHSVLGKTLFNRICFDLLGQAAK